VEKSRCLSGEGLSHNGLGVGRGADLVVLVPDETARARDDEGLTGVVALDELGGVGVGEVVVGATELLGGAGVGELHGVGVDGGVEDGGAGTVDAGHTSGVPHQVVGGCRTDTWLMPVHS